MREDQQVFLYQPGHSMADRSQSILSLMNVLFYLGFVSRRRTLFYPWPLHYTGRMVLGMCVAGTDNTREIDEYEANICRAFGERLAEMGLKLSR